MTKQEVKTKQEAVQEWKDSYLPSIGVEYQDAEVGHWIDFVWHLLDHGRILPVLANSIAPWPNTGQGRCRIPRG